MSDSRPQILNVLADRYASTELLNVWSEDAKIIRERQFWITVLKNQIKLGYKAPAGVMQDYEKVVTKIDINSIRKRELRTNHDVMARIEEFNALAGHECIHVGMTSRDVTENTEQQAIRQSLELMRDRFISVLARLDKMAGDYRDQPITGRSHNVPAQITTLGKRFATAGEELLLGIEAIEDILARYQARGIKGPMGTTADQLNLLESDPAKVANLEQAVMSELGFEHTFVSIGQIYPRSLDLAVVDALIRAAASIASLATTIRLMAGLGQATEGFAKGRVGSSAMPHKMNASRSERVAGLYAVLGGSHAQLAAITGNQWYEGDVTCSVVRRVAIPNAFFAADGLVQTALAVLDGFGAYPAVIEREIRTHVPFLSTTTILLAAVAKGVGRETAHEIIKENAVATARAMRESGQESNDLIERLLKDGRLKLSTEELNAIVTSDPLSFAGLAPAQVDAFRERAAKLLTAHSDITNYSVEAIL